MLSEHAYLCLHVGFGLGCLYHFKTALPLNDYSRAAIGHFEQAYDLRDGPYLMEVIELRCLDILVFLRNYPDYFVAFVGFLYELNAFVATNGDRNNHSGKKHVVAQRQYRKLFREFLLVHVLLFLGGNEWNELSVGVVAI